MNPCSHNNPKNQRPLENVGCWIKFVAQSCLKISFTRNYTTNFKIIYAYCWQEKTCPSPRGPPRITSDKHTKFNYKEINKNKNLHDGKLKQLILFIINLIRVFPLLFSYNPPFLVPKRKKKIPFSQLDFPLIYRPPHYSYFYGCYIVDLVSKDIFFTLLVSSPSLSLNSTFCEIFFLFSLSYTHLIRQMLG